MKSTSTEILEIDFSLISRYHNFLKGILTHLVGGEDVNNISGRPIVDYDEALNAVLKMEGIQ